LRVCQLLSRGGRLYAPAVSARSQLSLGLWHELHMADAGAPCLTQDVASRLEPNLGKIILAVADAVTQCAALLRELGGPTTSSPGAAAAAGGDRQQNQQNAFGDVQCAADLATDAAFWACLRRTGCVSFGCSEEQPQLVPLCDAAQHPGPVYAVAWDPLDGSSVVDAAFSVGSIVGVWPQTMLGATGGDQAAALYAVYGPRTVLVVASRGQPDGAVEVHEYVLCQGTHWLRTPSTLRIQPTSVYYAPANVRCSIDNEAYHDLLQSWQGPAGGGGQRPMTLRYSGALVADVHHILTKGGGIFVSPGSDSAPSKLRLVFEALPIAFIVHATGGDSLGADGTSLLGARITSCEQKTVLCVGSAQLVAQCRPTICQRGVANTLDL
jgi:sedoheptulose-bisphosphatase